MNTSNEKNTGGILDMIGHVWSVACSSSITDKESNNISLINLIERLNVTIKTNPEAEANRAKIGWYATPISFDVASRFVRKVPGDLSFGFRLTMIDSLGKELGDRAEGTLAFPKDLASVRTVVKVSGFPVTVNGMYRIVMSIKDVSESEYTVVQEIPIEVVLTVR